MINIKFCFSSRYRFFVCLFVWFNFSFSFPFLSSFFLLWFTFCIVFLLEENFTMEMKRKKIQFFPHWYNKISIYHSIFCCMWKILHKKIDLFIIVWIFHIFLMYEKLYYILLKAHQYIHFFCVTTEFFLYSILL